LTSFRNGTHAALIEVLSSQRKALKLTMRMVAAQMPKYLGWDHTTVAKIENGRRNISFVEVREFAKILETNLEKLDLAVQELENANYQATRAPRKKR
jgi:transcriptional regulator with XRE-family HTH domain